MTRFLRQSAFFFLSSLSFCSFSNVSVCLVKSVSGAFHNWMWFHSFRLRLHVNPRIEGVQRIYFTRSNIKCIPSSVSQKRVFCWLTSILIKTMQFISWFCWWSDFFALCSQHGPFFSANYLRKLSWNKWIVTNHGNKLLPINVEEKKHVSLQFEKAKHIFST